MVQVIQQVFIQHLKVVIPQITKLEYFSDGCAGQYKNKNNLYNLFQHMKNFELKLLGISLQHHTENHLVMALEGQ